MKRSKREKKEKISVELAKGTFFKMILDILGEGNVILFYIIYYHIMLYHIYIIYIQYSIWANQEIFPQPELRCFFLPKGCLRCMQEM